MGMSVYGQVVHSRWNGRVTVRSSGMLANAASSIAFGAISAMGGDRWFTPTLEVDMRNSLLNTICFRDSWTQTIHDMDDVIHPQNPVWWKTLLFPDFNRNYDMHVGYSVEWRSLHVPIGASLGVRCEWQGFSVQEGKLEGMHRTINILPSFGVNYRILGLEFERENNINIVLRGDVFYVKNVWYNNPLGMGSEVINDGLRVSVGSSFLVGIAGVKANYRICYEWDCYNMFNISGIRMDMGRFVSGLEYVF